MTRLDEIRQREFKAAKGPWVYEYLEDCSEPHHVSHPRTDGGTHNALMGNATDPLTEANFKFAAAARGDIPYLLSLVERLRELADAVVTDGLSVLCGDVSSGNWFDARDDIKKELEGKDD